MKAWLNLRHAVPKRRAAFVKGLERVGYKVLEDVTTRPGERDILVTWNRIGAGKLAALAFESRGRPVLVTENAAWGNDFGFGHWYTVARRFHNTAGMFPIGSHDRWDDMGIDLLPWRTGGETVILPQRGIGPPEVAMPLDWAQRVKASTGARIRPHPGTGRCIPLDRDLDKAGHVITWGSGAAIKALMLGIRVTSHMPNWIGEQDNTDEGRLAMFRRLAHAQWRLSEIETGEPFKRLLAA